MRTSKTQRTPSYDVALIERARLAKGWTKWEVALKAGVSPSTYTGVLTGRTQSPGTVRRIARVLGIDLASLVLQPVVARGNGRR